MREAREHEEREEAAMARGGEGNSGCHSGPGNSAERVDMLRQVDRLMRAATVCGLVIVGMWSAAREAVATWREEEAGELPYETFFEAFRRGS